MGSPVHVPWAAARTAASSSDLVPGWKTAPTGHHRHNKKNKNMGGLRGCGVGWTGLDWGWIGGGVGWTGLDGVGRGWLGFWGGWAVRGWGFVERFEVRGFRLERPRDCEERGARSEERGARLGARARAALCGALRGARCAAVPARFLAGSWAGSLVLG